LTWIALARLAAPRIRRSIAWNRARQAPRPAQSRHFPPLETLLAILRKGSPAKASLSLGAGRARHTYV